MQFPKRGEIHWAKIPGQPGDTKERPVLVVSTDSRNQFANDILVVPLSTTLRPSPTHVYLPAGSGGISLPSVAKCELIAALDKIFLLADHWTDKLHPHKCAKLKRRSCERLAWLRPKPFTIQRAPRLVRVAKPTFSFDFQKSSVIFSACFQATGKAGLTQPRFINSSAVKRMPDSAGRYLPKGSSWQNE